MRMIEKPDYGHHCMQHNIKVYKIYVKMSEEAERRENNEKLQKEIELEFIQNDDDKISDKTNNTNSTQTTVDKKVKETTILQNKHESLQKLIELLENNQVSLIFRLVTLR